MTRLLVTLMPLAAATGLLFVVLAELKQVRFWHHGYVGILLALIGHVGGWWVLAVLGWLALLDDLYQHWRQITTPAYRSPGHQMYAYFYARWRWVRTLTTWLDVRLQ